MNRPKKLILGVLLAVLAFGVVACWMVIDAWNTGKAKATLTYMTQVHSILEVERPTSVEREDLLEILAKYNSTPRVLEDGWGHLIMIEIVDAEGPTYRLRSMGRDGELGPCCSGIIPRHWNEDVVLEGGDWLQLWSHFGKLRAGPDEPSPGAS